MGALLNDLNTKGIWKFRVDLSDAYPERDTVQREMLDGHWVELREPSEDEFPLLQNVHSDSREIVKLIGKCLIDHSFESETGKKAPNGDVFNMIKSRTAVVLHISRLWLAAIPFGTGSATTSKK